MTNTDNGADSYRRFLDGDDNGMIELVRDYKDGLILFLNRYVNNIHTAEDLTEDTFVRLATKKPRFQADHSFKTWLYAIGRNIALNYLKREKRISGQPLEKYEKTLAEENLLERSYLLEERKIQVHRTLSQLQPEYARILYLKFFEELTNEQIARILKKNKRQIENLTYQAKQSLKAKLEKEGIHYEGL